MPAMEIISHGFNGLGRSASQDSETIRHQMGTFELGRFLLANLGLNGEWTSYVLLHPDKGRQSGLSSDGSQLTELEGWLLNRCPIFLATQERFRIFKRITQPLLRDGIQCASIPSGLMDDLLSLDYAAYRDVNLTAVDLDEHSLEKAKGNRSVLNPKIDANFEKADAWSLPGGDERWDLVTSNGLNIYVDDDARCIDLYASFAKALKSGGHLVISFITPADTWQPYSKDDLAMQRQIFAEAVPVKWQCVRSEQTTRAQLEAAGFSVVSVEYDTQRMFPAVLARKR